MKLIKWKNRSSAQFFSSTDRFNGMLQAVIDNRSVIVITRPRDRG